MPAEDTKRIRGDVLRRARKGHESLSKLEELAVASKISPSTIQRAEKGKGTFETVERLACTLGANAWDFWIPLAGGATSPTPSPTTTLEAQPAGAPDAPRADDVFSLVEDIPAMRTMIEVLAQDMAVVRAYVDEQKKIGAQA